MYGPRLDRYSGVTHPNRAQLDRLVEQMRLGEGDRPASHASHDPIIPL
jgi:hypothetical protein